MKHLLFVYGTLLSGYNNHKIIRDAVCLGEAITQEKFTMYTNGYYPAITQAPLYHIIGEVYEIDNEMLICTDHLEGYDVNKPTFDCHYNRESINVILLETGREISAFVYYQISAEVQHGMKMLTMGNFRLSQKDKKKYLYAA